MRTKEIKAMITEGLFKPKAVISRAQMQKLAKRARPSVKFEKSSLKAVQKNNLRLLTLQTAVNKELHDVGLHLASRDYYTEFVVLPKKETGRIVQRYYNRADNAIYSGICLEEGRDTRR